jgi:hypothetical protein
MKFVLDWIWFGPWWAPLIGAIYFSIILGMLAHAVASAFRRH